MAGSRLSSYRLSATRSSRSGLQGSRGTNLSATNAKPCNDFAGLHRLATCCGLTSSRHCDVCRPVVAGFRVALSEVSSIGLISIHDVPLRLTPARVQVAPLASRPLSSPSVPRVGLILTLPLHR